MNRLSVLLAVAGLSAAACAAVRPASPFADGAVLQRDRPVPVWGTAEPGETVAVSFAGQERTATADARGCWRVDLPAMQASDEGRELRIGETVIHDVLVGEVWFCSGQSNCELPLWGPRVRFRDRDGYMTAQTTDEPLVRYAYCSTYQQTNSPLAFATRPVKWRAFTRENLLCCDANRKWGFSATGVYFALELRRALKVPVGIVGAYWGGSPIERWLADGSGAMFNAMVAPWRPYALKGVIWYQGCSNANAADRYCARMHELYDGWAKAFANPDLGFRFVQIAPYGRYQGKMSISNLVRLQEAQAKFAAEEPHAAMAVINDHGNLHDIHPNEKGVVGRRLAFLALKHDYGKDIAADSPVLRDWKIEGNAFRLSFDNVKEWTMYTADQSVPSTLFEIAGEDGIYRPAQIENLVFHKNIGHTGYFDGEVEGRDLVVSAPGVAAPKAVRFLHQPPYSSPLMNEAGLPLGVFHIDAADSSD